jgi:hypothetical protein
MKKYLWCVLAGVLSVSAADPFGHRLDNLKTSLPKNPSLPGRIAPILQAADAIVAQPLIRRLRTLDEVLNGRSGARKFAPHGRTPLLVRDKKMKLAETFGLALSDVSAARLIYQELPAVAAAYRVTGKPELLDYLLKQLEELSTWQPIQRTGWTINMNTKSHSGRRDGVWLGTGFTIMGAVLAMDMLPPDAVPAELKGKIDAWLTYEVKLIASDWTNQVPWYVRKHAAQSNQWVVPSAGLLCAASYLGKDRVPEEYAQGLNNILETMTRVGDDGSSSEGFTYATSWTVPALYTCAYLLQRAGDNSLAAKPFFANFPGWLAAHYQPGGYIINCFDYWGGCRNMYDRYMLDNIAMLAAISDSPISQWLMFNQHGRMPGNAYGLLCYAMPAERMKEPSLYAQFECGRLLTWRSTWQDDASGLWLRGRDPEDFHAHFDCGHINYVKDGKLMLLEAGTTGYSDKRMMHDYKSLRGHNVIQVGEKILNNQKPYEAPFKVAKLDAAGGDVTIEATKAYDKAKSYSRQVVWDKQKLLATDRLELNQAETIRIRWHLGTAVEPRISQTDDGWDITIAPGKETFPGFYGKFLSEWGQRPETDIFETSGMTIHITADQPVTVTAAKQVDHTIKYRKRYHEHIVLTVKTDAPVENLNASFAIQ